MWYLFKANIQGNYHPPYRHKRTAKSQRSSHGGLGTGSSRCVPGSGVFPLRTARRSGIARPLPYLAMLSSLLRGPLTPSPTCFSNPPMGAQRKLEPANRNAGPPGNLNRAGRLLEPHRPLADRGGRLERSRSAACAARTASCRSLSRLCRYELRPQHGPSGNGWPARPRSDCRRREGRPGVRCPAWLWPLWLRRPRGRSSLTRRALHHASAWL